MKTYIADGNGDFQKVAVWHASDGSAFRRLKEAHCHDGTDWRLIFRGYWEQLSTISNVTALSFLSGNLIASTTAGVFSYSGGSWTRLGGTENTSTVYNSGGTLLRCNFGTQVESWSGSAWSILGSSYLNPKYTKQLLDFGGYVFSANLENDGIDNPSRYFSGGSWNQDLLNGNGIGLCLCSDSSNLYCGTNYLIKRRNSRYNWTAISSTNAYCASLCFHSNDLYSIKLGSIVTVHKWTGSGTSWDQIGNVSRSSISGVSPQSLISFNDGEKTCLISSWEENDIASVGSWDGTRWISFGAVGFTGKGSLFSFGGELYYGCSSGVFKWTGPIP
jgi:hypothetical protein